MNATEPRSHLAICSRADAGGGDRWRPRCCRRWRWRRRSKSGTGDQASRLEFDGDAAFVLMQVKDILDHGWYWSNPDVGAPFGQTAGWFADASWIHYAVDQGPRAARRRPQPRSARCTSSPASPGRLDGVLAGPNRSASPGSPPSSSASCSPCFQVTSSSSRICGSRATGSSPSRSGWSSWCRGMSGPTVRDSVAWTRARLGAAIVVVGLGGVYYVAFTLVLMLVVVVLSIVAGKGLPVLRRAAVLGGGVAMACLVPIVAAMLQTRGDTVTGATPGARGFWQSETFAGKIVDLVLPWIHHRVPGAAALTSNYASATIATVEQPALGFVALAGICGLLALGLASLLGRPRTAQTPLLGLLTVLTLTAVAFYTRGGLGALTAVVVTPSIRTWSRFVLVIALLGLLAVGLAAHVAGSTSRGRHRCRRGRRTSRRRCARPDEPRDRARLRSPAGCEYRHDDLRHDVEKRRGRGLLGIPAARGPLPRAGADADDDGLRPASSVRRLVRAAVELRSHAWHSCGGLAVGAPFVGRRRLP